MRRGLVAVGVLLAAIGAAWYGLHYLPRDLGYEVETEFAALPADDEALAEWLRAQPGVYLASVQREAAGQQWRLVVGVGMTRDGWGRPPFPDLTSKCTEFGYRGQTGGFRDRPR